MKSYQKTNQLNQTYYFLEKLNKRELEMCFTCLENSLMSNK